MRLLFYQFRWLLESGYLFERHRGPLETPRLLYIEQLLLCFPLLLVVLFLKSPLFPLIADKGDHVAQLIVIGGLSKLVHLQAQSPMEGIRVRGGTLSAVLVRTLLHELGQLPVKLRFADAV